jgi:hypothetical protein
MLCLIRYVMLRYLILEGEAFGPSLQVELAFNALELFNHAFYGKLRQRMKQQIYHILPDILGSLKNIWELYTMYNLMLCL